MNWPDFRYLNISHNTKVCQFCFAVYQYISTLFEFADMFTTLLCFDYILTEPKLPGHAKTGKPSRNDENIKTGKRVHTKNSVSCSQTARKQFEDAHLQEQKKKKILNQNSAKIQ